MSAIKQQNNIEATFCGRGRKGMLTAAQIKQRTTRNMPQTPLLDYLTDVATGDAGNCPKILCRLRW